MSAKRYGEIKVPRMRGASIHADYSAELWMSQLRSQGPSQETCLNH
jgi:hypothetical protein